MKVKTMLLGRLGANGHLVWSSARQEALLIDCGGDADKVITFLEEKNLKLTAIILSHGHGDHIMGVSDLKAYSAADIIAHQKEKQLLGDPAQNLSEMVAGQALSLQADRWIEGDAQMTLMGETVSFYHTPGHTPGGMCIEIGDMLFTGDTLFKGSIGRTDLIGGNYQQLERSLARLKKLPHRLVVYSGHGDKTTLRDEIKHNPFMK